MFRNERIIAKFCLLLYNTKEWHRLIQMDALGLAGLAIIKGFDICQR
jgi:hypothetical protein